HGQGEGPAPDGPGELFRRTIVQSAVRAFLIVVAAPVFQFFPSIGEMEKDFPIQTFVPQPAVETLDVAVLNWATGPDEVELHTSIVGPGVHGLAGEFAAIVC